MKKIILLGLLIFGCFVQALADSKSDTLKRVTVETERYNDIEPGWSRAGVEWLYNGEKTMLTPVFYTMEKHFRMTITSCNEDEVVIEQTKIASSGSYSTTEKQWEWKQKQWYYDGTPVRAFPPSFTKRTVLNSDLSGSDENHAISNITESTVLYQIKEAGWVWNSRQKMWEWNKKLTNKNPVYVIVESTETKYQNK